MRRAAPVLALALAAALGGCTRRAAERADANVRVGIVLSTGGRGDHGFNDAVLAGAAQAARELGADTAVTEHLRDEGSPEALAAYARERRDLVVGISFLSSRPAFELAQANPGVRFAVLDYSPVTDAQGRAEPPPANLAGVTYRSEEGAFLAGALAGLKSATHRVGFVGGMDAPVIRQFEAGYTAGVREVCPDCVVLVDYAGTTPAAFSDPARGHALAAAQLAAGADVIFHASGATGAGVFQAVRESPPGHWAIGVDVDQNGEAPGRVLTSVTKNLGVSLVGLVREVKGGTFRGGVLSQGLAEGAVGYVYGDENRALIPESAHLRVETLKEAIVAGLVRVPRAPARRASGR